MYDTLAELRDAFAAGTLSPTARLVLDNDHSYLYDSQGEALYQGPGPEVLASEALALLGIPFERA